MWLFFSLNAITDFWMLNQSYISGTNYTWLSSVQLLSYVWLFATPWTAAGQASLLINQQLPEFTQIHVHWVGDAVQPSHPLSSPSPPALNLSQHLFKWVSSLDQVAKILELRLQHQSFQWTPRTDLSKDGLFGSPCSPRDSQESSPTPQFKNSILQHSAFFIVQISYLYKATGKTIPLTR